MPRTEPFEEHTDRYEQWFETYDHAYESEVKALQRLVLPDTNGVEIGVGTGRFAAPLGIRTGVDPSGEMLQRAADRGITAIKGVGEALPLADETFETALVVTTICFVDDIEKALTEAKRILQPGGHLIIGYIDKESPLGERYLERKDENPFYQDATFVSTDGLVETLDTVGFGDFDFVQTIFRMPEELTEPDSVTEGYGEGSFVGIDARLQT
jgi:SAM-dependent methyltransferase